ncbi:hypothetical protein NG875_13795 [Enterococcus faecalis]|nr:hypothetical protein [Enterococcus faecalis]MCO5542234.1 hypothetical protein [Enterococcus faecalis]
MKIMYILALDVSMGKSYVVIYHETNCLFEQEILYDKTHFNALLQEIYALPERPQIVFEAKRQLNSDLRSVKTDKRDAHRLAQPHGQFLQKHKQ